MPQWAEPAPSWGCWNYFDPSTFTLWDITQVGGDPGDLRRASFRNMLLKGVERSEKVKDEMPENTVKVAENATPQDCIVTNTQEFSFSG